MRVAVYTDYAYHRGHDGVYAERAFALFITALADELEHVVVLGRLDPSGAEGNYPLGDGVDFRPLPFYGSLASPAAVLRAAWGSLRVFWRVLGEVDGAWLLGPHPLAIGFALLARARSRHVVLGVRQDLPALIRLRHPRRPALRAAALILEHGFRTLARFMPTVVVGPAVAHAYRHARDRLEILVSLVDEDHIDDPAALATRSYEGELRVLSVGRIDVEKNPMLLADVLGALNDGMRRWRLVVCGEGPLEEALAAYLDQLGLAELAELRGYVPFHGGLLEAYRGSHIFLHVSRTEGVPQVLLEAFAAGLPAVATDVGGVAAALGDAVVLVPPDDPHAAAAALRRVADDPALRKRLVAAGHELVSRHTMRREVERVAAFLQRS